MYIHVFHQRLLHIIVAVQLKWIGHQFSYIQFIPSSFPVHSQLYRYMYMYMYIELSHNLLLMRYASFSFIAVCTVGYERYSVMDVLRFCVSWRLVLPLNRDGCLCSSDYNASYMCIRVHARRLLVASL